MKKLFLKIGVFLFIVLLPLIFLDHVVTKGLRNTYFTQGCLNDVYNSKVNADVLICGASKAKFQISPKVLDSTLHSNSYNIGLTGWPFHMQWGMFNIYIQHNKKPKYIIHTIDGGMLKYKDEFYEAYQFMPYAKDTLVQKFTHQLKGAFSFAEIHLPLFIYNNHLNYITMGFKTYFNIGKKIPTPNYKGYMPQHVDWDSSFERFKKDNPNGVNFSYCNTIRKEFVDYLNYCRANDIKLIFVYPPVYFEETKMVNNQKAMLDLFNSFSKEYSFPIIDYNNDTMCYQRKYFMNSQHLNADGAEIFSVKLANDLKPYIVL